MDLEKTSTLTPCPEEPYNGPGGLYKNDGERNHFRKPKGFRETAIMFFKGFLMVQALVILFYKIDPTIASVPRGNSLANLPADDWKKYVRAPANSIISPARIVSNLTIGNVKNPDGLITGKGTTLTRTPPTASNVTTAAGKSIIDIQPEIVVDFGQNYAGYLSIEFGGARNSVGARNSTPGFPGIRLAFSETLEYLTNVSDFSRSDNVSPETLRPIVATANDLQGDKITPGSDQVY